MIKNMHLIILVLFLTSFAFTSVNALVVGNDNDDVALGSADDNAPMTHGADVLAIRENDHYALPYPFEHSKRDDALEVAPEEQDEVDLLIMNPHEASDLAIRYSTPLPVTDSSDNNKCWVMTCEQNGVVNQWCAM